MFQPGWEGTLGGELIHIYMYGWDTYSLQVTTTLLIGYTSIQNKIFKTYKQTKTYVFILSAVIITGDQTKC